jgi:hypothetical protein
MLPCALIGYVYPKGFVIRRVNNSGDISWHKGRVFVSQVSRFEDLGFGLVAEDFYKVFFRDVEIGEFDAEALRLDLYRLCLAFRRNDHLGNRPRRCTLALS